MGCNVDEDCPPTFWPAHDSCRWDASLVSPSDNPVEHFDQTGLHAWASSTADVCASNPTLVIVSHLSLPDCLIDSFVGTTLSIQHNMEERVCLKRKQGELTTGLCMRQRLLPGYSS